MKKFPQYGGGYDDVRANDVIMSVVEIFRGTYYSSAILGKGIER